MQNEICQMCEDALSTSYHFPLNIDLCDSCFFANVTAKCEACKGFTDAYFDQYCDECDYYEYEDTTWMTDVNVVE